MATLLPRRGRLLNYAWHLYFFPLLFLQVKSYYCNVNVTCLLLSASSLILQVVSCHARPDGLITRAGRDWREPFFSIFFLPAAAKPSGYGMQRILVHVVALLLLTLHQVDIWGVCTISNRVLVLKSSLHGWRTFEQSLFLFLPASGRTSRIRAVLIVFVETKFVTGHLLAYNLLPSSFT